MFNGKVSLTDDLLNEFKQLIDYWFYCNASETLSTKSLNFEKLANNASSWSNSTSNSNSKVLSATFFRNIYYGYANYINGQTKWASLINPAKDYLLFFKKENPVNSNLYSKKIENDLWLLYKTDKIDEGLSIAEDFLKKNKPTVKILKRFFSFEMRGSNYTSIRKRIEEYNNYEQINEFKALFKATLFECELREGYELIPNKIAFLNKIQAASYLLEDIPDRLTNNDYHYLLGRYYMEKWWANQGSYKTLLEQSLNQFTKVTPQNWWTECYKCIVLKLLGKEKEFLELANAHKIDILQKQKEEQLMASLKIHSATAHIMLDKQQELETFLKQTPKPKSSTDFNSSLRHHVDVIYYSNKGKIRTYKQLIENWK